MPLGSIFVTRIDLINRIIIFLKKENKTIFNQNEQSEMFEINMQQFGLVNKFKNKNIERERKKVRVKKREDN